MNEQNNFPSRDAIGRARQHQSTSTAGASGFQQSARWVQLAEWMINADRVIIAGRAPSGRVEAYLDTGHLLEITTPVEVNYASSAAVIRALVTGEPMPDGISIRLTVSQV